MIDKHGMEMIAITSGNCQFKPYTSVFSCSPLRLKL